MLLVLARMDTDFSETLPNTSLYIYKYLCV